MRQISLIGVCVAALAVAGCIGRPTSDLTTPRELSRAAGWKGSAVNAADAFRFVVMSDRTGGHEPGAWAQAVAEVNRLKPDFVMCIGDLVEGYRDEEAEVVAEWKEFDELTRKLDAPFFYCPGNHDVAYGVCRKVYRRLHGRDGRPYYSFNYRGCHFVVLDSTAIVNAVRDIADAQWVWLEADLAAARAAKHVFLFLHHPLNSGQQWQRLRKMLDPSKTTVFSGHYHTLSYDLEDGVPFFVLGPTATTTPPVEREEGAFRMFAHVAVSDGRPSVAIIPLGEVLAHDFISRAVPKRVRAVSAGMRLTSVTRAGGQVTLHLSNPTDTKAEYLLSWTGPAEWFAGGLPKSEALAVGAGKSARKTYRVRSVGADLAPPVLAVDFQFTYAGQQAKGKRKLSLPVAQSLRGHRVREIKVDGKLDDWAKTPASATAARWQVRDNPDAWTGPEDCSFSTRIGYDQKNLYVAVDVTDQTLWTEAEQSWYRDGIEVFWDPRPPAEQDGRLTGPCRQLLIPVPAEGAEPVVNANPTDEALAAAVQVACRARTGGYTFELAIPFPAIAKGFRAAPGKTLRMEIMVNDRDGENRGATSCMVLSGDSDASRNTAAYGMVTFE